MGLRCMLHHHRLRDFFNAKKEFFGTVLGIFGVVFVKALNISYNGSAR